MIDELNAIEDLQAERSLLATIGAPGAERIAADIVSDCSPDIFSHPGHRDVFCAIRDLISSGEEVNYITVKANLLSRGKFGPIGENQLLDWLGAEEVGRPRVLVAILERLRLRRRLVHLGHTLVSRAQLDDEQPSTIVSETADELACISSGGDKGGLQAFGDVSGAMALHRITQRDSAQPRAVRTRLARLDQMLRGGFRPGQMIVLAARPGMGKTSLALQVASRAATDGHPVAIFSLEMDKQELWIKLVSNASGVPTRDLEGLDDPVFEAQQACDDLNQSVLMIDDTATTSMHAIRSKLLAAQTKLGMPFGLVVIDYLQLISSPDDKRKQNETLRISDITRAIKLMAKDLKVPVIILSQLNREVEKRQGGKPQLSDLRDSGAIEQDADIVIFIHRDSIPGKPPEEQPKEGMLILAKHRGGSTGTIPFAWDGPCQRFLPLERLTSDQKPAESWPSQNASWHKD